MSSSWWCPRRTFVSRWKCISSSMARTKRGDAVESRFRSWCGLGRGGSPRSTCSGFTSTWSVARSFPAVWLADCSGPERQSLLSGGRQEMAIPSFLEKGGREIFDPSLIVTVMIAVHMTCCMRLHRRVRDAVLQPKMLTECVPLLQTRLQRFPGSAHGMAVAERFLQSG